MKQCVLYSFWKPKYCKLLYHWRDGDCLPISFIMSFTLIYRVSMNIEWNCDDFKSNVKDFPGISFTLVYRVSLNIEWNCDEQF